MFFQLQCQTLVNFQAELVGEQMVVLRNLKGQQWRDLKRQYFIKFSCLNFNLDAQKSVVTMMVFLDGSPTYAWHRWSPVNWV